ncbi:PhzF family phenazine biosynthesis protein [Nesterenkonia salmonea]|uniref:PhzF family phenazine biosynthesis protein n=1 Tax=Nesterenkonia salmonea TaxID=1804987 RepID=A0A5R9BBW1_9MICC|nr:PhzF family phenazine biosynthesis isomerase [Nesterenkonia salmonea]TLP96230.1 PhzF family phenazine biosynthesis protein [Nesterenkonia salmonea]
MVNVLRYSAFTTEPGGGNPAGVVLGALNLPPEDRQRIAAEVGYSETAFVEPGTRPSEFLVRYYSPLAEVEFCGHATIATAVALADRDGVGDVVFETRAGRIDVKTEWVDGVIRAALTSVETRSRPAETQQVHAALAALGWSPEDLSAEFPVHEAFGGEKHLILVAATRERLADLEYDFEALKALMSEQGWTTVQLIWPETDQLFHSRNPFPVGGVVEDPATGAAAAAFGGYLRSLGRIHGVRELTVLQGEDMGRPSQLQVRVDEDSARVVVAGSAVQIPG